MGPFASTALEHNDDHPSRAEAVTADYAANMIMAGVLVLISLGATARSLERAHDELLGRLRAEGQL